jgi:HEPN domain-containing protein
VSLARDHLERARAALSRGDSVEAVVWSALCAEIAIDALAAAAGIDTRKDHFRRASMASRLHEQGLVETDLRSLVIRLNDERKRAVYEGGEPDLRGRTWAETLAALEVLVVAAEQATGAELR